MLEPTFSEYAAAARASGMEVVRRVARRPEEGFRFRPRRARGPRWHLRRVPLQPEQPHGRRARLRGGSGGGGPRQGGRGRPRRRRGLRGFRAGDQRRGDGRRRALGRAVFHQVLRDTGLAARLPGLRRRGPRPEAATLVAGQRRRRRRRHRRRRRQRLRRSVGGRGRPPARRTFPTLSTISTDCSLSPARRTSCSSVGRRASPGGSRAGACWCGVAGRLWGSGPGTSGSRCGARPRTGA